jgi:hypothetical protein
MYMRKTYGPAVIAELDSLRLSLAKVPDEELREMLQQYEVTV